jgi:hypothetical protein
MRKAPLIARVEVPLPSMIIPNAPREITAGRDPAMSLPSVAAQNERRPQMMTACASQQRSSTARSCYIGHAEAGNKQFRATLRPLRPGP